MEKEIVQRIMYEMEGKIKVNSVNVLQSWVQIQQSPLPTVDCQSLDGLHLGWHFTVGCPLRGGRGVFI